MNDKKTILLILGIVTILILSVVMFLLLFGPVLTEENDSIAIVDLKGEIGTKGGLLNGRPVISAPVMRKQFEKLAEDSAVKGVLLRINSGGGAVIESKEISRALVDLKEVKPVVAYISDIGASGAYYIASHSDAIVSDADSLVGSIGVVSVYQSYEELFEEKLGINTTIIKSGEFKDLGTPYKDLEADEQERLQEIVDTVHQEFMAVIREQRPDISDDALEKIETGNIFLGSEAKELGLVDVTGSFDMAVDMTRDLAKAPDCELVYINESSYCESDIYYSMGRGIGDSLAASADMPDFSIELR
jgi:protease-4